MGTAYEPCDICLGRALPTGVTCACGGSGLMVDAFKYARLRIVALENQLAVAQRITTAVVAWRDAEIGLNDDESRFINELNAALDEWEKAKETANA